jgi:hypothetical protein
METNAIKNASTSYITLITLITIIILYYFFLYIFFPNGFVSKLGYSVILTFILSIIIITLFRFYQDIKPQFKNIYLISGIITIGLGLYGIFYYLGLFDRPPAGNRFDLLFNYFSTLVIIIISYFIFIKKINVNTDTLSPELKKLHNYRLIYSIILIIFILGIIALYLYNPGKIMTQQTLGGTTSFIIILVLLFICFALLATIKSYDFLFNNSSIKGSDLSSYNFLKYLYILISFALSGLFIYGILYYLGLFEQESSTQYGSILVNILLLAGMIGILYKLFNVGGYLQKHPIYNLIVNTILYIPCLLVSLSTTTLSTPPTKLGNDFIFLIISLVLLTGYFFIYNYGLPYVRKKYYTQGGILLVDKPIPITRQNFSIPQDSNLDKNNYNYSFSFWFYLDSFPPNTNSAYLKENNILTFNNNIFITYNPTTYSLFVKVPHSNITENIDETNVNWGKNNLVELDEDNNRIIYVNKNVLLQKWNNIIVNYNGGTLDIFYNGTLVKSAIEVVPFMKYDNIEIGNSDGIDISGSVCNLLYFYEPIDILTINTLYTSLKDKSPPIK